MSSHLSAAPATCPQTPLACDALAGCHRLALLALARPGMQDWPEQRRQAQWHLERLAACLEAAHTKKERRMHETTDVVQQDHKGEIGAEFLEPSGIPALSALALREWLQSLQPGAVAGVAGHARQCPLANYLVAVTDYEWEVQESLCLCSPKPGVVRQVELPNWADQFVVLVDHRGRQTSENGHMAVTREMALRLLAEALAMEERSKAEFAAMIARHQAARHQAG